MNYPVEWLNYNHFLYFWTVARNGSLSDAAAELMLSPSTVSAQIHALEEALGAKLFRRRGRRLVLTELGQLAYGYGESIFPVGREFLNAIKERPTDRPVRLAVGIDEAVPKLLAREILKPALQLPRPIRIMCREGDAERLLPDLTSYHLDVIVADQPAHSAAKRNVFSHPLGEFSLTFFAAAPLARQLKPEFPRSLHRAPALLPTGHTAMRRSLDRWFESIGVEPMIAGEFDDSALAKVFGSDGFGFFAVPNVIAAEIAQRYTVEEIGTASECTQRFYAITAERKLKHPAVLAITQAARATPTNRTELAR